ncbi:hypothetical protein MTO96_043602, partial [Rhipicephalus appendiculatus]
CPCVMMMVQSNMILESWLQKIQKITWGTTVASIYIRPQQPWDPRCLRQLAHRLEREFLLCGDVNAHHPAWGGRRTDPRGREVRDILQQLGLVILNTGADTFVCRGRQATSTAIDLSVATEGCRYAWSPLPDTWGLFQQNTGGRDLLQLVADYARAAAVVTKARQGQPVPYIQHLAFRAARRRAERQARKRAQPELWTSFRRVDAVCRRHARGSRNQGCVSVSVSIDSSRDGTRAWRLLKCLLMVPRAFSQVLSLAVHLSIQAADLAEQLADQFASSDVAQLPAAPPPAALPCPASCYHPGWVAAQVQELCSEPVWMHELVAALEGDQTAKCSRGRRHHFPHTPQPGWDRPSTTPRVLKRRLEHRGRAGVLAHCCGGANPEAPEESQGTLLLQASISHLCSMQRSDRSAATGRSLKHPSRHFVSLKTAADLGTEEDNAPSSTRP